MVTGCRSPDVIELEPLPGLLGAGINQGTRPDTKDPEPWLQGVGANQIYYLPRVTVLEQPAGTTLTSDFCNLCP